MCPRKHPTHAHQPPFTIQDAIWNDLQAHYRSRVERIIRRIKSHAWCEGRTFRGSYALLVQCLNTTVITTALEIRHGFLIGRKPQFEVVGPWPHAFQ